MSHAAPDIAPDRALASLARALAREPDLAAAYLYGSRARGRWRQASDFDVAVILRAGLSGAARWHKRLQLADAAASALGTDRVDVVLLEEAPAPLGHRIIRDGRPLVDRDPRRRVQVTEDTLRRYLDEAPLRAALDEGLRSRLRGVALPVDPLVLRRRLRAMERYLRTLRELRRLGRDMFVGDAAVQDRVERNAELLAQACIDVALHIVAASGSIAPETYGEALRVLAPIVGLPQSVTTRLAAAARLRNLLVHMYLEIDHGRLYDEMGWIDDAESLAVAVDGWMQTLEPG